MSAATVLVTGGAGYVGSHACKALAEAGYLPVAFDNLVFGHEWAARWGPLEKGDIRDRARLIEVLQKHAPQAILHFAAFAYVGELVADPGKYYENNVAGSLNLAMAARECGIDKFIFSSTCATYGVPDKVPIAEDTPQQPVNPYGASKLMFERMLADLGSAHDLSSVVLRYFNAAGADPDAEIGEDHDPETYLIPLVLDAASGRREHVTVLGTDYETPDGTCVRDYVHVSDLADAHVKALRHLENGGGSAAFNLGTGHGYSVREVIDTAARITGRKVPVIEGARRPGDPAVLVADAARAREQLTWQPRHSDLDQIIATAWAWHQKRHVSTQNRPSAET